MGIFNKKKIAELERDNINKDRKIRNLEAELASMRIKLSEIQHYANTTPTDCVRGEWCRACEFARAYHISQYYMGPLDTIYVCGKGESCKNFVQKERD